MKDQKRNLWILAGVGIVLAVALRLTIFAVSCAHMPAFDDECKIALQAKQIAAGERPLLILASPYIFPLDAYLMAPFIKFLPRTTVGARILATGFGLLAMLFSLMILRRWGPVRDTWPGMILILFGSSYLLFLQHGCAMPAYDSLVMISALAVLLAQRQWDEGGHPWHSALVVGLLVGLACSETMLCLPILIMVGAMVGLHRNWRAALGAAPAFSIGAFLGLVPHFLAKVIHSGAFGAVQHSVSVRDAFHKLLSPALNSTLPSALGFGVPLVPDSSERIVWLSGFAGVVGIGWAAILVVATLVVARNAFDRWRSERWPSVDALMVFTGISWLCLGLFLLSGRSHSHTYRYFTPLLWSFPFLVAGLYQRAGRFSRILLGGITLAIVAANLSSAGALLTEWRKPGFANTLKSYDLTPVISYLDSRGITRGYASYVDAYRFTFNTDGRITLCQVYNERFPGWPVPFKDMVDASTNVAYVLSDSYNFTPVGFEADLVMSKVGFQKKQCGGFTVYTDFVSTGATSSRQASLMPLRVSASHNPGDARFMMDGQSTFWRCAGYLQMTGMWVSVELATARTVGQILFDHALSGRDHPVSVHVSALQDGAWRRVAETVPVNPEAFEFVNGHPVYGREIAIITLPKPVTTVGIKIEIAEPRSRYAWTLAELKLLEAKPVPGEAASR